MFITRNHAVLIKNTENPLHFRTHFPGDLRDLDKKGIVSELLDKFMGKTLFNGLPVTAS